MWRLVARSVRGKWSAFPGAARRNLSGALAGLMPNPLAEGFLSKNPPPLAPAGSEQITELERLRVLCTLVAGDGGKNPEDGAAGGSGGEGAGGASGMMGTIPRESLMVSIRGGPDPLMNYALALSTAGDLPSALRLLNESLPLAGSDVDRAKILCALGEALDAAGAHADALVRYKSAAESDPRLARARTRLGWGLIASAVRDAGALSDTKTTLEEARAAFAVGIELARELGDDAGVADMLIGCGVARGYVGDSEGALREYAAAIDIGVNHAPAYKASGILQLQLGRLEDAIVSLTSYLDAFEDHYEGNGVLKAAVPHSGDIIADTLLHRGAAYIDTGKFDDAIADFDRALRVASEDNAEARGKFLTWRGKAWLGKGEAWKCIKDEDEALTIDSKNVAAYMNRAAAYHSLGDKDQAEEDMKMANLVATNMSVEAQQQNATNAKN